MKSIEYNRTTKESLYEHNGVTFRCTPEAVNDILFTHNMNVFTHIESAIDKMIAMTKYANESTHFSVAVKVTWDKMEANEVKTGIAVVKIPRLASDPDAYPNKKD